MPAPQVSSPGDRPVPAGRGIGAAGDFAAASARLAARFHRLTAQAIARFDAEMPHRGVMRS